MLDVLELRLTIETAAALYVLAEDAERKGRPDVAALCKDAVAKGAVGPIVVHVPAVHVLCQACDLFRAQGKPDVVEALERLVAAAKARPRVVTGTMHVGHVTNERELDAAIERMRAEILQGAGG